eukprot:10149876-Ditylum_brightwellii.AAC.1
MDMIKGIDINNNKEIDFEEFKHLMKSRISDDPGCELRLAFDMIDSDGNSTISENKLKSLMRK